MTIGAGWAEGAWVDAGWVVGAWAQPTATKTIGGTSQLGAITSTGGITVQNIETIGGTAQIDALSSTGGLNLGWQIGGTSQLNAFTSTGGIQAGDVVEEEANAGGWYFRFEQEQFRKRDERRKRKQAKEKAKEITSDIDRQLALAERALEERQARDAELERLTSLVSEYQSELTEQSEKIAKAAERVLEEDSFAAKEILERELMRDLEERQFLIMATMEILNA